jgi:Peptidase inhibitor I78 family
MLLVVCARKALAFRKWRAIAMHRMIAFCALFAAVGCVAAQAPVAPPAQGAICGADQRTEFLGQPLVILQAAGLPPGVRVIRPGDAITEDYSDQRLNIDLDANDRVTRLWCG